MGGNRKVERKRIAEEAQARQAEVPGGGTVAQAALNIPTMFVIVPFR